jgi:two-component system phosphate regulon sensor histidine kinase PhoR
MTISLIVFVTLQFYWLKRYYGALDQDFSSKVYSALENTSKTIGEIEVNKYLNEDNKDFRTNILANSSQPSLTTIQQVEDSGTQRQIVYSKSII